MSVDEVAKPETVGRLPHLAPSQSILSLNGHSAIRSALVAVIHGYQSHADAAVWSRTAVGEGTRGGDKLAWVDPRVCE